MAIRWDWSDKMGECFYENGEKVNLYQGNCLTIALTEHEDGEDKTYSVDWFFADEGHMKNILGLTKGHKNSMANWGIKKIRLDTKYKSVQKIVAAFARAKMKIEIELYNGEEETT